MSDNIMRISTWNLEGIYKPCRSQNSLVAIWPQYGGASWDLEWVDMQLESMIHQLLAALDQFFDKSFDEFFDEFFDEVF